MATTRSKYFYPPRPGNGTGTFSDEIVGLQTVTGGGLTQGNFEFTTNVVEKVNRTFNVGAFSTPISLEDLNIDSLLEGNSILETQFRVYPKYDVSQVLNFSMYGSLVKRFSVSVTKIINYFPASIDILYTQLNLTTGATAVNIAYDSVANETYFEINVNRVHNPFDIDYTVNATNNLRVRELEVSKYRNIYNTYLDYAVTVNGIDYKVESFSPSQSFTAGTMALYVSGSPFGVTATTWYDDFVVKPNDYITDKVFEEDFDEVEKFLINRLVNPIYTSIFQVPQQNEDGQFYIDNKQVTWPKDGMWNLDIRSLEFDSYLTQLQAIARVHPETGRIALYVSPGYTLGIEGWPETESDEMMMYLFQHQARPEFVYSHRWSTDMLLMWDNRCLMHLAINDYDGSRRLLHRTTVAGERPKGP